MSVMRVLSVLSVLSVPCVPCVPCVPSVLSVLSILDHLVPDYYHNYEYQREQRGNMQTAKKNSVEILK